MRWQTKTILLVAAIAPPTAGILLQVIQYWPQWSLGSSEPNHFASFIFTALGITIPLSYVFGLIPSIAGGAVYCAVLTYLPSFRHKRWLRAATAAAVGALAGAIFGRLFNDTTLLFALLGALVAAILAMLLPRSTHGAV
jgi:cell shape-determining protein MreD